MTKRRKIQPKDMQWLVEHRSRVQSLLHELWQFRQSSRLLEHRRSTIFNLLVGGAFSLWRAVFLIEGTRQLTQIGHHAHRFLGLLVWDNAINYHQDRETREWSAGYYLNNAHVRFSLAGDLLKPTGRDKVAFDDVETFIRDQLRSGTGAPNLRKGWDQAFAVAEIMLRWLQQGSSRRRLRKTRRLTRA